ncbi:hypothetical protein [Nonomuraea sp. NPDC049158]|uniref:hypothetical protein n=1 Tax=Nonomuraea sp. NPDC049158 TaxID=3155649 RepID=UPI0033F79E8B
MRFLGEPHHDGSALYVSTQAPAPGSTVTVRLRAPLSAGITGVHVRTVRDGEPRFTTASPDTAGFDGGYGETDVWWRADLVAANPVTPYRFLCTPRAARRG